MNPGLSNLRSRRPGLFQILEQTIEVHGMRELQKITQREQDRGVADPNTIPELSEFWARSKSDIEYALHFLRKQLRNPPPISFKTTVARSLDTLSKSFGFLFSWSVTQSDIQFFLRGSTTEHIALHRPIVLSANILLAWLIEIVSLASSHPALTSSDNRKLKHLKHLLIQFAEGFRFGTYRKELLIKLLQSIQFLKKRESSTLRLEAPLYNWLVAQIKVR